MTVVRCTLSPNGGISTQAIAYFFSLIASFQLTVNSVSVVSGDTIVDLNPNGRDVADVVENVGQIQASVQSIATLTQATVTI
jgi:hypothetical protein